MTIVLSWPAQAVFAAVITWIIAAAVLGWRAAKALQDVSMYGVSGPDARDGNERDGDQAETGSRTGQPAEHHRWRWRARTRPDTDARPRVAQAYADRAARQQHAAPASARRSRSRTPWPSSTR